MAQRRVTIKDVAAHVGVSITTVSHVLNEVQGKRISDATAARVREAAEALGYQPNHLAQSLRTQRSHTIGLIGDEVITTPFAGRIILGAQDVATRNGAVVLAVTTGYSPDTESREIAELMRRQVDGILYASMYHREVVLPPVLDGVPAVIVNAYDAIGKRASVVPDEFSGGWDAASELIAFGHQRVAFINDIDDVDAARGREAGFRARFEEGRLSDFDIQVVRGESDPEGGYQAARQLLNGGQVPTGIFCFNDRIAMGVYRALAERGLRVPEDVSVVGFDNQDFVADGIFPGLTTIQLPHYDMGVWAATELFRQIETGEAADAPTTHHKLRGPVVHRSSVAAPRGARLRSEEPHA